MILSIEKKQICIYLLFIFIVSHKLLRADSTRKTIKVSCLIEVSKEILNHNSDIELFSGRKDFNVNDSTPVQLPLINIPNIDGAQSVKTLVEIKPHGTNIALTLIGSELVYLPVDESDSRQLWWIIQDYSYHAFAFANASNTDKWLYYDEITGELIVTKNNKKGPDGPLAEEYLKKQYFFEFEIFEPMTTSSYAIRNIYSKKYLQTTGLDSQYSDWRIEIGDFISNRKAMYFKFVVFKGNSSGEFVYLPISETDYHTQSKENRSLRIQANQLITDNKAYLSSSYGFLINRLGGEDMFKITFDSLVTESEVGLLHYRTTIFNNLFYQKQGSRRPIAGIRVRNNSIYIFNKDNVVSTPFKKGVPIIFGYRNGELIASQSNHTESISGVSTPTLLNSTDGNKIKMLIHLPHGEMTIGYNPSILLFGHDFKGEDSWSTVMTNPYMSVLEDPENRANEFDWTSHTYNLRYKVYGTAVNEQALSPFYYNEDGFGGIVAKHDFDGRYLGGEDFDFYDGWELITHDFGYDRLGNEKPPSELRREPYMILYNRYTSKLRVFVYMSNPTIANNLKISLSDGPRTGIIEKYRPARLWGSYLQGLALDDPDLSGAEYSKMLKLKRTTSGSFYFADFTLSYNPCVAKYESNLQISVSAITQGNLEITGKTLGGVIPVNSPSISNWLSNSNHYLTGVLNTPYGELTTTLGDINFRNFNQWGAQQWGNTASFVLPGKKVEDWEREAAKLSYQAENIMSSGDLISGAGKLVVGSARLASSADITDVSTKIGEGIGTIMDGIGTIIKGTGRGIKAKAFRLKYDNLRDEPDKEIRVTLPAAQPSVVFSELVAKGSLSIETVIFDDVVITTPGSKYSEFAPNEYAYSSKGTYPLYNEQLGIFNLLYQPEIALSIVRESKDIGGYIRLKNRNYIAVNGNVDYFGGFFMVNYVVTTYDASGYSTASNRTKPYLFSNVKIPGVLSLPVLLDISEFLDKQTLLKNIAEYKKEGLGDIEDKINDWVIVELEVEFFGYTGKNSDGTYGVSNLSNSYKSNQIPSYEDATGIDKDISSLLVEFSDLSYGSDYLGKDIDLWGGNYLINSTTEQNSEKMDTYCALESTDQETIDSRSKRSLITNQKNLEYSNPSIDLTTELEKEDNILVYPNPSRGIFTISYLPKQAGKTELLIYDSNGNLLISHIDHTFATHSKKRSKIDISNLQSGIYILVIGHESGESYRKKLIKN